MKLPKAYAREAIRIKNALVAEEAERSNWDRRNQWGEMYCIHGTNVGTWDGADLMCGYCEDGTSHYEVALASAYTQWERDRQALARELQDTLVSWNKDRDGLPGWGDVLTHDELGVLLGVTLYMRRDLRPDLMRGGVRAAVEGFFKKD